MLGPQLRELLNWPRPLPLEDERVRLLHEVKQIIAAEVTFSHNCMQFCNVTMILIIDKHLLKCHSHISNTVHFYC